MAAKRKPKVLESPWGNSGDEIIEPGIGLGFVQWEEPGEAIRGKLLPRWRSRTMRSAAVAIELTEVPTVPIFHTEGDGEPELMACNPGDKVNVSLLHDLDRKLTANLEGKEIGIQYTGDQPTPKGAMRVFRVFHFADDQLPF